ncbi:MFS transporter [Nocardia sp. NPDC046763]|uniref:MFS transporter n=1 Tax=Nocardia sp. NPDC046763 TaxID=3155256 RepID=UPI0033C9B255
MSVTSDAPASDESRGVPGGPGDTGRLSETSRARVFAVLTVIVLFTEVTPMQYTIVAAALQKIAPSFPGVGADINWSIIIFGLVGAVASPVIGKMSDVWGKKRMFLICGWLFVIGCLLCAVTSNWVVFLIGRGLQATAVATTIIAYGLIRDLLPRKYIPLGLGITATGIGFAAVGGPLVGGFLVDSFSWRAVFWCLGGFSLLMMPVVVAVVPESALRVRDHIDMVGAALLSIGSCLVLIYLNKGQDWGWGRAATLAWLIGGIVLLALFFLVEMRSARPIMDMTLLFQPRVSLVLLAGLLASFYNGVHSFAIAYMAQSPSAATVSTGIQHATLARIRQSGGPVLSPDAVAVSLNPAYTYGDGFTLLQFATHVQLIQAVLSMVFGAAAGALARRLGARLPLVCALALFTASAACFALLSHSWVTFFWLNIAFGIGFGLYHASMPILMVEGVPQEQQGISLGMLGIMQSMGMAVGVAVVTAFLRAHPVTAEVTVDGHSPTTKLLAGVFSDSGYELGFWFSAVTALIALAIALIMRHGRTPATGGAAH